MKGIGSGRQPGEARGQGVVARRAHADRLQAVVAAELGQGPCCEQPQVAASLLMAKAALGVQRIAHDHLVAHVGRHGLVAKRQGANVVPAREVVGRKACHPSGCEQAAHLGHEGVGAAQVLDHLAGVDYVEFGFREGQLGVEVRADDM